MGFAMRHHGESRTETGNGSALSSITRTDMDTKKTTLAELIDAYVAADRYPHPWAPRRSRAWPIGTARSGLAR